MLTTPSENQRQPMSEAVIAESVQPTVIRREKTTEERLESADARIQNLEALCREYEQDRTIWREEVDHLRSTFKDYEKRNFANLNNLYEHQQNLRKEIYALLRPKEPRRTFKRWLQDLCIDIGRFFVRLGGGSEG